MDSWVKKMGGHIICQGQKGAIGKNVNWQSIQIKCVIYFKGIQAGFFFKYIFKEILNF